MNLVKYAARRLSGPAQTLDDINKDDKYRTVVGKVFDGTFLWSDRKAAYIPQYVTKDMTAWLAKYYEISNEAAIRKKWAEIRGSLRNANGGESAMLHDFRQAHVYFMQNVETEEIKIGMSIHPGVRRQQLRYQERADMRMLHIHSGGGRKLEGAIHRIFGTLRSRGPTGEWFYPKGEIFEFIESMRKDPEFVTKWVNES